MTQTMYAMRRAVRAFLMLVTLLTLAMAFAQNDDITFDVEVLRVDLVRGDDGQPTERFMPVEQAFPGEVIEYRVTARNEGDIFFRPGTVVVTLPIGEGAIFLDGTATPSSRSIITAFSVDGGATFVSMPAPGDDANAAFVELDASAVTTLRWTFTTLFSPDQAELLVYRVEIAPLEEPTAAE